MILPKHRRKPKARLGAFGFPKGLAKHGKLPSEGANAARKPPSFAMPEGFAPATPGRRRAVPKLPKLPEASAPAADNQEVLPRIPHVQMPDPEPGSAPVRVPLAELPPAEPPAGSAPVRVPGYELAPADPPAVSAARVPEFQLPDADPPAVSAVRVPEVTLPEEPARPPHTHTPIAHTHTPIEPYALPDADPFVEDGAQRRTAAAKQLLLPFEPPTPQARVVAALETQHGPLDPGQRDHTHRPEARPRPEPAAAGPE